MSSSSKKKSLGASRKKEEKPKHVSRVKILRPAGAAPLAVVTVRHGSRLMSRQAKGYSVREVEQAGLGVRLARKWGLSVDDRRRSALEGNVSSLKKWISQAKKTTTEARVQGEMRAIEKAVEKEVQRAEIGFEKEVERAELEVEKIGKEVAEKVEAPVKKRASKKAKPKQKSKSKPKSE